MSNLVLTNTFRFLGLLFLQVLILQRVGIGWTSFPYIHILLYPLFIILLPMRTPKAAVMLLAFLIGISVDLFYSSPGIHASASVFTGFIRSFILARLEPRGGYNVNFSPTKERMGLNWFLRYAGILMAAHLFFYFSVEAFTFVFFIDILIKTLVGFVISMMFIILFMFIFNPRD